METKKEYKFFSILEHKKEEAYLRRQHNSGWKFVKVTGFGTYHFIQCQPEDVVYQLDYNPEAASAKGEYLKMFADCGWDYIQDFFGYSYFRKAAAEMNGEEEIFSDQRSHLAMMERVYKGRLLPLLIIFTAALLPQFITNLSHGRYVLAAFLGAILVVYLAIFTCCAVYYYRLKK